MIAIAITSAIIVNIIAVIVAVNVETQPQLLRSQLNHLFRRSLAARAALGLGSTRKAQELTLRISFTGLQ